MRFWGVILDRQTGEVVGHAAWRCGDRFCPICAQARTRRVRRRVERAAQNILAAFGETRFLFLTLTARNVPVEELQHAAREMGRAFKRLMERAETRDAVKGYVRFFEVTRGRDGNAHPHLHVLIAVDPDYFTDRSADSTYLPQERWAQLWRAALRARYRPVVDVRAIRPSAKVLKQFRGSGLAVTDPRVQAAAVGAALGELAKYPMKLSSSLLEDPVWFLRAADQMVGVRAVSTGGCFKPAVAGAAKELERERELERDARKGRSVVVVWRRWNGADYVPVDVEEASLQTRLWLAREAGVMVGCGPPK
jgi:plasmid rolling circle replication initiator protein Rep